MSRVCLFLTLLCCSSLYSQNADFTVKRVHQNTGLPSIIEFPAGSVNYPNLENAGPWFMNNLGASPGFRLIFTKSYYGQDSTTHARYKQYFGRFPVEYAEVIIHAKNGRTSLLNGLYYPKLQVDTGILVKPELALKLALAVFPESVFEWELPSEEKLLKDLTKNTNSTYFPKPSLLIFNTGTNAENSNFRLVYKFDILAHEPLSRRIIYIDAQTGKVLAEFENICTVDRPGIAHTRYSGIRTITCDSISPDTFRLKETGRGGGIITIDARIVGPGDSSRLFMDDDNTWNNVNIYKDDIATDAHWGAEKTYDYYFNTFNKKGLDDTGSAIISKVHIGKNFNNAFWNGKFAHYGDGDGFYYNPLITIDICGHELTHGVTEFSAGLVYSNESGALNESFSDIFGKCIEYYAYPEDFSWFIGHKIKLDGIPMRDMSDPNRMNMPKFYNGERYYHGSWDNGGVHTNSSVQNLWFYLLCKGDTGHREDNNKYFKVTPIGMDKAAKIAYLSLMGYLTPASGYTDMSYSSIDAAISLFGPNSFEVIQVQNAWFAVGLFDYYTEWVEPEQPDKWVLSPNPNKGRLWLSNLGAKGKVKVRITDVAGQYLLEDSFFQYESLDISHLAGGVYFITINDMLTLKFVMDN